jgi:hypothetical protein
VVIQPNEVIFFKVRQNFEEYDGIIKFGTSFRVLTTEGNALLSSVAIGEFDKKDSSKFRMSVSNLNLISNKAKATVYHSDLKNNDLTNRYGS